MTSSMIFENDDLMPAKTRFFFKLAFLWRRASVPTDSPHDKVCARTRVSSKQSPASQDQAETLYYSNVKTKWRNQQIANQQKLVKAQRNSWSGWTIRRESAPRFLHRRR